MVGCAFVVDWDSTVVAVVVDKWGVLCARFVLCRFGCMIGIRYSYVVAAAVSSA